MKRLYLCFGIVCFFNLGVAIAVAGPLFDAAQANDIRQVRHLLARGADANETNKYGATPLHVTRSKEIAGLLIANGANVNAADVYGRLPLHKQMQAAVDLDPTRLPDSADQAEIKARFDNVVAIIKLLIANGAQVTAKDKDGYAPLQSAVAVRNTDLAALLIAKGADAKARASTGWTPLHAAASVAAAKLLIANGADINAQNLWGETPLHTIVWRYSHFGKNIRNDSNLKYELALVEFLIRNGADMNIRDKRGNTPLASAKVNGAEAIANLLIKHGAGE